MEKIGEYMLQFGTVGASAWLLTKVLLVATQTVFWRMEELVLRPSHLVQAQALLSLLLWHLEAQISPTNMSCLK